MPQVSVRRAGAADAGAWVACYLDALEAAYGDLMPPAFGPVHRAREAELVAAKEVELADGSPLAPVRGWVAEDERGVVLAVACVRDGANGWERDRGLPPATATLQLEKLYAVPAALGTGAGPALFAAAVGDAASYLWLVEGNERAERFYRRRGYVPDGVRTLGGPTWFERTMVRLART
ncbi:GNAT family N-acetyltransferase [Lapillicoccus jejuensis]|uniref:Acetyltransferase (GNAT) family protein n=1 Tax=Lapillicoccus jejuensis TaxID=402171 RepID=A0A542E3A5_9MICO|nr:GNAT family N-acetyltransferase [Lapillicoccus jejuensis]TQJ09815.1 acetyltransferase (GNAT) family protein [Lapillicoccus jejuensis]